MPNCDPPVCSSEYDEGCEAVDCLFNVEALNIDKLFKRTNDLKSVAEAQQTSIEDILTQIAALEVRIAALESA